MRDIHNVVVLGAGTMGAAIAAHCANHGLEAILLDVDREAAGRGLQQAVKAKPAAFFLPELAARVPTAGLGDAAAAAALGRADWVVEAIIEDLDAKRRLLAQIAPHLRTETIVTTNTSGLSVAAIGAELGTHFFNPPRYLRLVEIIRTPATDAARAERLERMLERRLGKDLVEARDTPNFIANRIGLFALMQTLRLMEEFKLGVEEVDALTGPVLGWPKSATFRTLDLIGLNTLIHVVKNSHAALVNDEARGLFVVPAYIEQMAAKGLTFYRKQGEAIAAIDAATLEYHPRRHIPEPPRTHPFIQRSLDGLFGYCDRRLGEITDDPEAINRAMRWGYNWQWGPFELRTMLAPGGAPPARPLASFPAPVVRTNPGCSLRDLGDGVGCLEFHSKMNAIGGDIVALVTEALHDANSPFDAFVIGNGAENFSVGADLMYLLALIAGEEWEDVEAAVRAFQTMTQAVKFSPRPVVVAPAGMALGGGCELTLHAAQVVAHAELYTGLVEVGAGLIPAGGGTKEMALRLDPKQAFETIAMAKVSTSAAEARQMRVLRRGDLVIAHRDRVLAAARQAARLLADAGYEAPAEAMLTAHGPSVEATLELGAFLMHEGGKITDFEMVIARKLAHVICAGGTEQQVLDLEREAFLSLCGEPKTQERIGALLKTGKPLRN